MRKLITASILLCILAGLMVVPCVAAEFRGLWVDAFHPGFKSPEQTAAMVAKAAECNFNAIFVQVRRRGDVYFRSSIEPMAADVASGYDPLADVVAKAHEAGLRVHAWVTCFEVYHDSKWTKQPAEHVYLKHPEWLTKDGRGRDRHPGGKVYLDPGLAEARDYVAALVSEIATNYGVDGIHLDSVSYLSSDCGYNDGALAKFKLDTQAKDKPKPEDKAWGEWRRSQLTQFVKLAGQKIKQSGKSIQLSAAVIANRTDAYFNRFQNWVGWLNEGTIDFAVPMVFPLDQRVFDKVAADVLAAPKKGAVYIGQAGWRMKPASSLAQIASAQKAGAQGLVIYNYYACSKVRKGEKASLMDQLKAGPFGSEQ